MRHRIRQVGNRAHLHVIGQVCGCRPAASLTRSIEAEQARDYFASFMQDQSIPLRPFSVQV
jgi:hypothetical protein